MNAKLVFCAEGNFVLEGQPMTLEDLAAAFQALPAGTSIMISFEKGGQQRSLFRRICKLIYGCGLEVRLLDVSSLVNESAPVRAVRRIPKP